MQIKCTDSPEPSLLAQNGIQSPFVTKAQTRPSKCADSPEPSLFARMTPKIYFACSAPHYLGRGGGGVPVLLFPLNTLVCSPVPQVLIFLCPLFPNFVSFSPFSLKIWPWFPCTTEINALFHWYPNPLGWPHITVSIILFGTVTIKFFLLSFLGLIF